MSSKQGHSLLHCSNLFYKIVELRKKKMLTFSSQHLIFGKNSGMLISACLSHPTLICFYHSANFESSQLVFPGKKKRKKNMLMSDIWPH